MNADGFIFVYSNSKGPLFYHFWKHLPSEPSGWNDGDWEEVIVHDNSYGTRVIYNNTGIVDSTGVQFKTNSVLGSREVLFIEFKDKYDDRTGKVYIIFKEYRMEIFVYDCQPVPSFSADIPRENEKIWTIFLDDELRLTIDINGVMVFNTLMTQCTRAYLWKSYDTVTTKVDTSDSVDKAVIDGYRAYSPVGKSNSIIWTIIVKQNLVKQNLILYPQSIHIKLKYL